MDLKTKRIDRYLSPDKAYLECLLQNVANIIQNVAKPDRKTHLLTGIPLANNYCAPARTAIFGAGYYNLDATIVSNEPCSSNPWIDGARFTLKRENELTSTAIELMQHTSDTALEDIPFCITPSGSPNPISTCNFEQLVYLIDDLAQYKNYDSRIIFDPRSKKYNLAQALKIVIGGIGHKSTTNIYENTYKINDPAVSDDGNYFQDRNLTFNTRYDNGQIICMSFFIDTSLVLFSGTANQRLSISYDPNNRSSQIVSTVTSKDMPVDGLNSTYSSADERDAIAALTFALEQFEQDKLNIY